MQIERRLKNIIKRIIDAGSVYCIIRHDNRDYSTLSAGNRLQLISVAKEYVNNYCKNFHDDVAFEFKKANFDTIEKNGFFLHDNKKANLFYKLKINNLHDLGFSKEVIELVYSLENQEDNKKNYREQHTNSEVAYCLDLLNYCFDYHKL